MHTPPVQCSGGMVRTRLPLDDLTRIKRDLPLGWKKLDFFDFGFNQIL
jgi:hypothetical protein